MVEILRIRTFMYRERFAISVCIFRDNFYLSQISDAEFSAKARFATRQSEVGAPLFYTSFLAFLFRR